jgi:predicted PurR-regulated permease PerM
MAAKLDPRSLSPRAGHLLATLSLLGVLAVLSYLVLRDFVAPLVWAGILAYVIWPLHRRLCARLDGRRNWCAALTTLGLTVAIVLPVSLLMAMLQNELSAAFRALRDMLTADPPQLPELLGGIPWIGPYVEAALARVVRDPGALGDWLADRGEQWIPVAGDVLGAIGRNILNLAIALAGVFFVLRDGEEIVAQSRRVLWRFLGPGYAAYWDAVASTTRGVVYGLVLTALAQGALAGLGYWVTGTEVPVLLAALTALLALIPFGAPLVWAPLGLWLLATGQLWPGIGLLLWGGLVVSWVDNIVRPLAISSATRIPFLIALVGVLGGLSAFGLVGLFAGPMVLAVLLAVWREWLEHQTPPPLDGPEEAPHEP